MYRDPVIQKVLDVIKDNGLTTIKSYNHGDPLVFARSDLPAICISKDTTTIGDASNAEDYHRMNFVLTVVYDVREWLDNVDIDIAVGDAGVYDLIEGRNDNFTLKESALLDILRKNENLGNGLIMDLQTENKTDYGYSFGKRGEKIWAWEAYITFTLYLEQLRG